MASDPTSILARLFPPDVCVAGGIPESARGDLFEEEDHLIENAVEKRRSEFRAGRLFARNALAQFGIAATPIPARDRRPIWPQGFVGTIAHTNGVCGVAVARANPFIGLGLDIEQSAGVTNEMHRHVLTAAERTRLEALPIAARATRATLIFSAKEAFYKSLAEIHDGFVGFQEVQVLPDDQNAFAISPESETVAKTTQPLVVSGRYALAEGRVWTGVTLRRAD